MDPPEKVTDTDSNRLSNRNEVFQLVGFCLAGQEYGFRIEQIQEIVVYSKVTQLPQVADYVEGVCNLRGTIIPVIHLGRLLGVNAKANDEETRIIVVNVGTRVMGCIVDSVTQVIKIGNDSIQPAPSLVAPEGCSYIAGFVKFDERMIILLEIESLLEPDRLEEVHRVATEQDPRQSDK